MCVFRWVWVGSLLLGGAVACGEDAPGHAGEGGPGPLPPATDCLSYWDLQPDSRETLFCAALHDEDFLLAQTGPGLSESVWQDRFETIWGLVDDWYGAFGSAPVDWDEVHDRYWRRAQIAASRYAQAAVLYHMVAELEDSHAGYYDTELCESLVALPLATPFDFMLTEEAGELWVTWSEDPRVSPGAHVASINGLSGATLRAYWRERLKCASGSLSASAEQAYFEASALALVTDPLWIDSAFEDQLNVTLVNPDGEAVTLTPDDASDRYFRSDPAVVAYYSPETPFALSWEPYDTGFWGGYQTHHIGHARYQDVAVMVLYDFLGEEDFERALRDVVAQYPDVDGWIIDVRPNTGGGPHQETLASFFVGQPVSLVHTDLRDVGEGRDAFVSPEYPEQLLPDATIQIARPVAVLTNGQTVSAGDHFAFHDAGPMKNADHSVDGFVDAPSLIP